jgi:signal transduction histidine kinase
MRAKLVLLVLLVTIPLFAFETIAVYRDVADRTEEELQASRELAQATSTAFVNYLENLWDSEYAIGTAISLRKDALSPAETEAFLRAQLEVHPTVGGFSWLDPRGAVIASTVAGTRGQSLGDREHIKRIVDGKERAVSDLVDGRLLQGELVVGAARGIRREGRLVGIVVASIRPAKLGMVLPMQRGGGSNLGLVDRNGVSVYRSADPQAHGVGRALPPEAPVRQALRTGRTVVSRDYPSPFDPVRRMGVFYLVPDLGWVATASSRLDQVLASARAAAYRELGGLVLLTLVSLLAALLLGNSLLRPITSLEQAAQAISRGELKARVDLTGGDELATAAQAFNRMAKRIQQLEAERNRFLQTAAHALRNPMTTAKSAASLLRHRLAQGGVLGQESADDLRIMEQEIDRLSTQLDEVLDAFCLHEGQLSVWRGPLDLGDLVRRTLEAFTVLDKDHRYSFEETGSARVYGDTRRLEDVVGSLVDNAARFSPAGTAIRVRLEAGENRALLSVKDEGIGIPSGELQSIFRPFFRGSNLEERDPGGIGLGLYVADTIVTDHGGRLWAESVAGRGSTFWLELPRLSAM